eukprot:5236786-Prymnesium_polylepis.1
MPTPDIRRACSECRTLQTRLCAPCAPPFGCSPTSRIQLIPGPRQGRQHLPATGGGRPRGRKGAAATCCSSRTCAR